MIRLLGVCLLAIALYFLQRKLYERVWNRDLSVKLSLSCGEMWEGDAGELLEVAENGKRLPLPMLKVKFHTDRNLSFADDKGSRTTDLYYRSDVLSIGARERVTRRISFVASRRGYYTIDEIDLVASDLLLQTQYMASLPAACKLYVYPRRSDNKELIQSLRNRDGEIAARRHLLTDPFTYRGIREYQPTDESKSINWKASAKYNELRVNENDYTSLKAVRIFLNTEDDGVLKQDALVEECIRIAATISLHFLELGMQVAFYGNAPDALTGEPIRLLAGSGILQREAILKSLARADVSVKPYDFAALFSGELLGREEHAFTCIISVHAYESFSKLLVTYGTKTTDYIWYLPTKCEEELPVPKACMDHVVFLPIG